MMPASEMNRPQIETGLGQRRPPGETMEHAAQRGAALFLQNPDGVLVGFAGVDDEGPVDLSRQTHLRTEHRLLHLARREVVVVVETDFRQPRAPMGSFRSARERG